MKKKEKAKTSETKKKNEKQITHICSVGDSSDIPSAVYTPTRPHTHTVAKSPHFPRQPPLPLPSVAGLDPNGRSGRGSR